MKKYQLIAVAAVALYISSCQSAGNTQQTNTDSATSVVNLALVTKDVPFPVEAKMAPGDTSTLYIAALGGKIFMMKNGQLLPKPFFDMSDKLENKDSSAAARAMFSFTFDPAFATNHKFYVSYNAPTTIDSNKCKLVISQFEADAGNPASANTATEKRIISIEGHSIWQDADELTFGPDGYLYIDIGDNGTPMKEREGENLNSYLGKLLRIDVHSLPYTIPADNPFVHTKGAKPEIWAYGLRRLWRFGYDSIQHVFIGGDVGDKMEEEIDTLTKGGNYGWPYMEGDTAKVGKDSLPTNLVAPLLTYHRKDGICIIGGVYYHGSEIPFLQNKYVFADYNGTLYYVVQDAGKPWTKQQLTVKDKLEFPFIINSCDTGPGNEIYLCGVLNTGKNTQGAVYKITAN
ncbi:MAG TPA: PQQ-dependent sugar dehydrogenase [Chitinophagaceae bacterium]|nr:PQQ-dependent sugar dehydrogenase [Chitinophagaceae bacterium]